MNRRHMALLALAPLAATVFVEAAAARSPAKVIDEEHCVTEPVPEHLVPDQVAERFALGSPVHGDGALWSMAPDRTWLTDVDDPPGPAVAGLKLGWYRTERGRLQLTVHLMPSSEEQLRPGTEWDPPSARFRVPEGYGLLGFQVSGIEFPEAGCWVITGDLVSPDVPRHIVATSSFMLWVPEPPG